MAGMSGMSDAQRHMFEARLKRINRGGPNTSGHVIVGPPDEKSKTQRPRRLRRPGDFLSRLWSAFGHLLLVPVAFAAGGVAMLAGIVGGFQVDRMPLPEVVQQGILAQVMTYKEFLIAGLVALVLGGLFRLTRGPRKLALALGVAAVFLLQDSIIETYPEPFARLMPAEPLSVPEFAALPDF